MHSPSAARLTLLLAATALATLAFAPSAVASAGAFGLTFASEHELGGTAIDTDGHLLVGVDSGYPSSFSTDQVQVLDPTTGQLIRELGAPPSYSGGSGDGQLQNPSDVASDSAGNIWIVDTGNNRIQEFGPDLSYLAKFGTRGSANGQFSSPTALALDPAGNIYVADSGNNRVQKFDPTGSFMTAWGDPGTAPGQFHNPSGIDIGPTGDVFVVDSGNGRIQEFSAGGAFVREFGQFSPAANGLNGGLATDPDGSVYFLDPSTGTVRHFSSLGEPIGEFSCAGLKPGQITVGSAGIAVDDAGGVWVSGVYLVDASFHGETIEVRRLQRFGDPGKPLPCKPLEVAAAKRQSLRGLAVSASCPARPCELEVSGEVRVGKLHAKLVTVASSIDADDTQVVKLRLRSQRQLRQLERQLSGETNLRRQTEVEVTVRAAVDSANETAKQKVSFDLKRAK